MTETDVRMKPAQEVAKEIQRILVENGWVVANNWGELTDPSGRVWFGAGYVTGEITLTASYRPRGAGKAEGIVRVRVTPAFASAHPEIATLLGNELVGIGLSLADWIEIDGPESAQGYFDMAVEHGSWPPAAWAEHSR